MVSDEVLIDDQSHYEVSLTAGQAFVAFVLLLLSLAASFAFGLMIGKGQADERLVVRKEPAVINEGSVIASKKNDSKLVDLGVGNDDFKAPPPATSLRRPRARADDHRRHDHAADGIDRRADHSDRRSDRRGSEARAETCRAAGIDRTRIRAAPRHRRSENRRRARRESDRPRLHDHLRRARRHLVQSAREVQFGSRGARERGEAQRDLERRLVREVTGKAIERRLRSLADATIAEHHLRFFKCGPGQYGEGDAFLGIMVPMLRTLSKEFTPIPVAEAVALLQSKWHEARLLALMILVRKYERGDDATREEIYRSYLANTHRINNWDLVDASAPNIVGAHLLERDRTPSTISRSRNRSGNAASRSSRPAFHPPRRVRRHTPHRRNPARRSPRPDPQSLGMDASRSRQTRSPLLERFLRKHAKRMPRTMLRYAIERFPPELRAWYMAR